jgi:hypothetical protein
MEGGPKSPDGYVPSFRESNARQGVTVWNCRAELDVTTKGTLLDTVPPGSFTVICPVPEFSRSLAGICAVSVVELTKFVLSGNPFHCTLSPLTNPEPVIVISSDGLPEMAEDGFIDVIEGAAAVTAAVTLTGTETHWDPFMHCRTTVPEGEEPAARVAAFTVSTRLPGEVAVAGDESQLAPGSTEVATDSAPVSVIVVV